MMQRCKGIALLICGSLVALGLQVSIIGCEEVEDVTIGREYKYPNKMPSTEPDNNLVAVEGAKYTITISNAEGANFDWELDATKGKWSSIGNKAILLPLGRAGKFSYKVTVTFPGAGADVGEHWQVSGKGVIDAPTVTFNWPDPKKILYVPCVEEPEAVPTRVTVSHVKPLGSVTVNFSDKNKKGKFDPASVSTKGTGLDAGSADTKFYPSTKVGDKSVLHAKVLVNGQLSSQVDGTTVTVIGVEIKSPKEGNAFVKDGTVIFEAVTNPKGCEELIKWSGGGVPEIGTGAKFTTSFSTTGTKTVTANNVSINIKIVEFDQSHESIDVAYVWGGENEEAKITYKLWDEIPKNCTISVSEHGSLGPWSINVSSATSRTQPEDSAGSTPAYHHLLTVTDSLSNKDTFPDDRTKVVVHVPSRVKVKGYTPPSKHIKRGQTIRVFLKAYRDWAESWNIKYIRLYRNSDNNLIK